MRSASLLAAVCTLVTTAPASAQQSVPDSPPASERTGPVIEGRHRQPTPAEIESRQRAQGESAKAMQERLRKQDQAIDELYKELMKPVPSRELSGQSGQPAQ